MFKEIFKKIGNKDKKNSKAKTETKTETPVELHVHKSIETNLLQLKEIMGNCPDILIRRYKAGANEAVNCAVILLDGMTNQLLVTEGIFKPLHNEAKLTPDNAFPKIKDAAMTIAEVKETQDFSNLVDSLLSGDAILLIDGNATALIVGTTQVPSRSISEPIIEPTIRGPRDGFTEVLKMNIALIRRRIKSPRLQTESFNLGNLSKTKVMIAYIKGKADAEIVAEVRRRLKQIEM
ncbi:MAG: spore germination protein, partial [Bacillota bacterium]